MIANSIFRLLLFFHGILFVVSFDVLYFWYLTVVSWIFISTGCVTFSDVARRLDMLVVGIVCQVTFFIDASTYLRRYLVRMFMLGIPGLVVGTLMTKFG